MKKYKLEIIAVILFLGLIMSSRIAASRKDYYIELNDEQTIVYKFDKKTDRLISIDTLKPARNLGDSDSEDIGSYLYYGGIVFEKELFD